jgi:hypothetical protein
VVRRNGVRFGRENGELETQRLCVIANEVDRLFVTKLSDELPRMLSICFRQDRSLAGERASLVSARILSRATSSTWGFRSLLLLPTTTRSGH